MEDKIRKPVAVDKFYPGKKEELKDNIKYFLERVEREKIVNQVRALMLPHASYLFCGEVLGEGYSQIAGESRNTVILICNSHKKYFKGIALSDSSLWETPLGQVEVDQELGEKLKSEVDDLFYNDEAFDDDHTLEVHIPFLQECLKEGFRILPIIFGEVNLKSYKNFLNIVYLLEIWNVVVM